MIFDVHAFRGITADSRKVRPGFIYVAICGHSGDGHAYIPAAIANGATAIVAEKLPEEQPEGIVFRQVADSREMLNELLAEYHGRPEQKLTFFGITGTNGKTTGAYLVADLLNRSGMSCGLISTVEFRTPQSTVPASHTTPDPETFFDLLSRNAAEGANFISMELSSHALHQHRTGNVKYRAAVFTNLTGDHLDYHGTVENYFAAKKRLFTELLTADGYAIINIDDEYGRRLRDELTCSGRKILTFGTRPEAMFRIESPVLHANGASFCLNHGAIGQQITTSLTGQYNLFNLTGAIIAAHVLCGGEMPWEHWAQLARCCCAVPGRLERVRLPGDAQEQKRPAVFVDYAHTDDALRQVLQALRALPHRRIFTVFGCGGDRDRTKRPRMGQAVEELSDVAIVTSDNPRSENPRRIIEEIISGMSCRATYEIVENRREAIFRALAAAGAEDIVLIAGKGHETTQETAGEKKFFSDRETALEYFRHTGA